MKRIFRLIIISFIVITCTIPDVFIVNAGVSDNDVADTGSFLTEISASTWNNNNVESKDANLYFSGDCSIVAKTKVQNLISIGIEKCIDIKMTIRFESLSNEFYVATGLARSYSDLCSEETSEICFISLSNKIYVSVKNLDENLISVPVVEQTEIPEAKLNDDLNFNFIYNSSGGIKIYFDGNLLIEKQDAGLYTEGYVGFGQFSDNTVRIKLLEIASLKNDTPENINYMETFDKQGFNNNAFYSRAQIGYFSDSYLKSKDGNLVFNNSGSGFIRTQFEYSNFTMDFDLTSMQRTPVFSGKKLVKPINANLRIILGSKEDENVSNNDYIVEFSPENGNSIRVAERTKITIYKANLKVTESILPYKYNIWDESVVDNRLVAIRCNVEDANLTISIKYDQNVFEEILSYDLDYTPLGYVAIGCNADSYTSGTYKAEKYVLAGNFSIDNLTITNNDAEGVLTTVDYIYYGWNIPGDYKYTDPWSSSDLPQ